MRYLIIASSILFSTALADAKTCTASNNQQCTITCQYGCIAIFVNPNGPCKTECVGKDGWKGMAQRLSRTLRRMQPAAVEIVIDGAEQKAK
jgi:hypothetical protein